MISTKGRYALRFLVNLSRLGKDGQVSLKEVAKEEEISIKYLERIAHDLSLSGIIQGSQGKGGGYRLKKDADSLTMWEILSAVDEDLSPVACLKCGESQCTRRDKCPTLPMWEDYGKMTRDYFSSVTLSSLSQSSFNSPKTEYEIEYFIQLPLKTRLKQNGAFYVDSLSKTQGSDVKV